MTISAPIRQNSTERPDAQKTLKVTGCVPLDEGGSAFAVTLVMRGAGASVIRGRSSGSRGELAQAAEAYFEHLLATSSVPEDLEPLTARQARIFETFLRLREESGVAPTLRELAGALGISHNGAVTQIRALTRKRWFEMGEPGHARSIQPRASYVPDELVIAKVPS